jgi:hypothetical protein
MRKVINGKVYDTETAIEVCDVSSDHARSDFKWHSTTLYRTKKGSWFLAGRGHAMSMWASYNGNTSGPGSGIRVLDADEARELLERHGTAELVEKWFEVEEA